MSRPSLRTAGGFLAAALLMTLAACGTSNSATASGGSVTLVGGVQSEVNWWFPTDSAAACGTQNATTAALLYRPLLFISDTDGINFHRSIASGITVSNHDQTYTVHLNPKWHWSNGQPVTAQDAAYSYDIIRAANQPNAPWSDCFTGVGGMPSLWKSVTTPNAETLVVTTTEPVNPVWFEHNGLAQLIPIPKSVWDHSSTMTGELTYISKVANAPSNSVFKVVDGPYKIGTFVNDQYWTLLANPKYDGGHKATITKLLFEYETSSSTEFVALRRKTFATAGVPNSYYKDHKELTALGYKLSVSPYSFCFNYMVPNMSSAAPGIGNLFSHLYVRQALQMGIDQPAIIKDFDLGLAVETNGPVPALPKNQYYDPHITKYAYNLQAAKALLEAHGWSLQNGVMTKGAQKLQFTFLIASGSTTDTNIAQLIQYDWAKEGVKVTLDQLPFNQVVSTIAAPTNKDKWDMVWWGGGYCYVPNYYPLGTDLFTPNGGVNFGSYQSAEMTLLMKEAHTAPSSKSKQIMDEYQAYASKELPVLYMPTATSYQVTLPTVHGVTSQYNPITTDQWYNNWTIGS